MARRTNEASAATMQMTHEANVALRRIVLMGRLGQSGDGDALV